MYYSIAKYNLSKYILVCDVTQELLNISFPTVTA